MIGTTPTDDPVKTQKSLLISILSFLTLFKTNLNEEILLSKENPLTIKIGENSEPSPYILIRKNLHALLSRSVFYELVDLAEEKIINDKKCLVIESMGESFKIHEVEKE